MKTKIYILVLVFLAVMGILNAQTTAVSGTTTPFNASYWNAYADKLHLTTAERKEFISAHQKTDLALPTQAQGMATSATPVYNTQARGQGNSIMGGCINIDFESGNLTNWTRSCGFNPAYAANPSGCCLNPGGQQTIMSGAGLDPAGGFPVVAPGGSFSLRLGDNQTGGQADRVEQTFMVTSANANFTYRYAVVLEDPGHTPAQQPSFQIEMLDSSGTQIPCTFYSVSAGGNIPGFFSSPTMANVVYKPWSSVVADLTNLIGQNVTIRFTTYDCSLGGHFGYAYVDGSCLAFMKTSNDTICAGTTINYCAPTGFLSTTWNGPGIVNNGSQCISASAPGVYTCQTVLIPGCPGPDFTYTLSNFPQPVVSFTPVSPNACSPQFNFINGSTISNGGTISGYTWTLNNPAKSNAVNPAYTFPGPGNYNVSLLALSDKGCKQSAMQSITVFAAPVVNFNATAGCMNSPVSITNSSSGSIASYSWNFGNGNTSGLNTPSPTYTSSGNYVISLSATNSQSCIATQTAAITIYPKPTASFNSNVLSACSQQYTFTNVSSIGLGSIASYSWNFGSGSSALQNPVYNFPASGNYTVSMIAVSNQNCRDTAYKSIAIYPFPTLSFSAPSSCLSNGVLFTNSSAISLGSINSYTWNFGNGTTSNATSPSYTYAGSGNYVVTLSATSNQNCVATATGNVLVYAMPVASLSAANFCHGSTTSFTNASTVAGGSLSTYIWNFGDGNTATTANASHTYQNTGSYSVWLSVASSQGCTSVANTTVAIYPLPVLTFNVSNVCFGNTTSFTNGSSIATGAISSYSWNFGNSAGSQLVNPTVIYPASGSYVVSLAATSNQGCINTATSNVVIHPVPVISFSASNVCFGDNTAFLNNSSINSGSLTAFNWDFGDGSSSTSFSANHTYSNYGNYTVLLSATSSQNCSTNYSYALTIHPLPALSFSAANVCLGVLTQFSNSSSIPTGSISSWTWSFGGNQPGSTLKNPNTQYAGEGSYTVSLQGTSNKGCSSSVSKVVQVFPNPTALFSVKNVCFGEPSVFTNASYVANPDQITAYKWDFGNGSSSNFTDPSVSYANGGIYPVQLVVTTNNGCSRMYTSSASVYNLPEVNFSPSKACKDQATQFVNGSNVSSGTMAKCRWDFENDGVWDDTVNVNPVKTYLMHGNYSCKLEVQSSYQCKAAKTNNVIVYANPVADFTTHAVCLGDKTTFANKSTSADGAIIAYSWDFNGDNVIDNIAPSPTITYSANGTYLVRLEVQTQYGCVNVRSKSGYINAMPNAGFVSKNNKGCPNLNVEFNNTSFITTGSIVTTQWQFGDGSLPDYSLNPKHTYLPGSYDVTLKLVSDSGCISTISSPGFVTVYPKPVAGFAVNPDEVDENEPIINVKSIAEGAAYTHYYVNDGSSFGTENFSHTFKNISQVKPMVVQIVRNEYNCADTALQVLKIKPAYVIYIPNTFTPNGDGLNDGFQAKGVGISKFNMQIFDRWGQLLYEVDGIDNYWDGTVRGSTEPIKQDVYVWKAKVVDVFNRHHDLEGHVSLIR